MPKAPSDIYLTSQMSTDYLDGLLVPVVMRQKIAPQVAVLSEPEAARYSAGVTARTAASLDSTFFWSAEMKELVTESVETEQLVQPASRGTVSFSACFSSLFSSLFLGIVEICLKVRC
jgi:hypothetical protein